MSVQRYMLDADVLIYMLRGLKCPDRRDERHQRADRIRDQIERNIADGASICISMITVCELEYGAAKSADAVKERRALYKVLAPFEVLEADALHVPRRYGEIRSALDKDGQPVGAMDLLVAAHALASGAILVTNNTKEFDRIKGLRVVNWVV